MGVIDLDARVKKLEAGGGGGADPGVIDQLEAAVTDLEETVNGNGETDFGLVGDVATLETAFGELVTDITDQFTPNPDLTFTAADTSYTITKIGNMVFMNGTFAISAGASSAGSTTILGTIAAGYRPSKSAIAWSLGNQSSNRYIVANTNGNIGSTGGDYADFSCYWTIATT